MRQLPDPPADRYKPIIPFLRPQAATLQIHQQNCRTAPLNHRSSLLWPIFLHVALPYKVHEAIVVKISKKIITVRRLGTLQISATSLAFVDDTQVLTHYSQPELRLLLIICGNQNHGLSLVVSSTICSVWLSTFLPFVKHISFLAPAVYSTLKCWQIYPQPLHINKIANAITAPLLEAILQSLARSACCAPKLSQNAGPTRASRT